MQLNLAATGATSLVNLRLNNGAYLEAGAVVQIGNNSGGAAAIELKGISGNRSTLEIYGINLNANANGGQSFTVAGAPISRDAAVLGLGLNIAMSDQASMGFYYDGQFGSGNQEHNGEIAMRWRF